MPTITYLCIRTCLQCINTALGKIVQISRTHPVFKTWAPRLPRSPSICVGCVCFLLHIGRTYLSSTKPLPKPRTQMAGEPGVWEWKCPPSYLLTLLTTFSDGRSVCPMRGKRFTMTMGRAEIMGAIVRRMTDGSCWCDDTNSHISLERSCSSLLWDL